MKRRFWGIAAFMISMMLINCPAAAEESTEDPIILEITNRSAERGNVTVTLEKATAEQKSEAGGFTYTLSGTIENNSDEGIMQVIYTFAFYDENGEKFRSFAEVYDGEEAAIPPHTKISFLHDDVRWGPQSVPASAAIDIGSVKTETELPPVTLPKTGGSLYKVLGDEKLMNIVEEPPVEISFHIDQGGYGRTASFKSGEQLDKLVNLLCGIRIGEETDEWVSDNYNWIDLVWADGSETVISLNLKSLEYQAHSNIHVYALENLDPFWSYAESYLTEDE